MTVTPRGTDWSLALLVALGLATGLSTWFAGSRESAWVFAAHAALGTALALVLVWKLRRVWPRIVAASRWDSRTGMGLAALGVVLGALGSGVAWSSGANVAFGGMSLLGWHVVLGLALGGLVLAHALARARPLRTVDARDRRQLLAAAGSALPRSRRGRCSAPRSARSGSPAGGAGSPAPTRRARSRATTSR